MATADGYCQICKKPVPERMTNKFFCSHGCREQRLVQIIQNDGYEVRLDPFWGVVQGRKIQDEY